jgi:hypothetical protein
VQYVMYNQFKGGDTITTHSADAPPGLAIIAPIDQERKGVGKRCRPCGPISWGLI